MTSYEQIALQKHGQAFINKCKEICDKLGFPYVWLLAVMKSESNIDPKAVNPYARATGLIQFMPATANGLGTSVEALAQMSAITQLEWVYKYYLPYKQFLKTPTDLYVMTFYPYAMGKPDNYVFGSEQGNAFAQLVKQQNAIFDLNGDGLVTLGEFRKHKAEKSFAELPQNERTTTKSTTKPFYKQTWFWIGILVILVVCVYLYRKLVFAAASATAKEITQQVKEIPKLLK